MLGPAGEQVAGQLAAFAFRCLRDSLPRLHCLAALCGAQHHRRRWITCGSSHGNSAAATAAAAARLEPWPHADAPIERAATPPSSWYTQPEVLAAEDPAVFGSSWLAVAHASQLAAPGAYASGSLLSLQWLACRDEQGRLRAFHNVCRHHAALLADGCGTADAFRCGYHGWTYGLDGRLLRATRLKGIEGFRAADNGLLPLDVDEWGGLVWVRQCREKQQQQEQQQQQQVGREEEDGGGQKEEEGVAGWLGCRGAAAALSAGIGDPLVHVARREYTLQCNWKVFCDNYLDGGYHVSAAHPELAAGLDLGSYRTQLYRRLSIQSCQPAAAAGRAAAAAAAADDGAPEQAQAQQQHNLQQQQQQQQDEQQQGEQDRWRWQRLSAGRPPAYIFVYPNLMLNRYGPWLDTNTVIPLAPNRCKVVFDYYLEPELAAAELAAAELAAPTGSAAEGPAAAFGAASGGAAAAGTGGFLTESLAASHRVQLEDVELCESVQRGLESTGYDTGRYAPVVETAMHHFHRLLHADLRQHQR